MITAEGLTPSLGFQVATAVSIRDIRLELTDFIRRLAAARAWSLNNTRSYADTWGRLMNIPAGVPLHWLARAKVRIAPIDDSDLYFRWGLIKRKLDAEDLVDRSFSDAIAKGL